MVDIAQHAANQRAHDKAQPERRADHAETFGALLGCTDIGDIRIGGGETGGGDGTDQRSYVMPVKVPVPWNTKSAPKPKHDNKSHRPPPETCQTARLEWAH